MSSRSCSRPRKPSDVLYGRHYVSKLLGCCVFSLPKIHIFTGQCSFYILALTNGIHHYIVLTIHIFTSECSFYILAFTNWILYLYSWLFSAMADTVCSSINDILVTVAPIVLKSGLARLSSKGNKRMQNHQMYMNARVWKPGKEEFMKISQVKESSYKSAWKRVVNKQINCCNILGV